MDVGNVKGVTGIVTLAGDATSTSAPTATAHTNQDLVSLSKQSSLSFSAKAASFIEDLTLTEDSVNQLDALVKSFQGVIDQVVDEIPPHRRQALEKEAKELGRATGRALDFKTRRGAQPLIGDPIRSEIESTLGKSLEVVLPDLRSQVNLGTVSLSTKDFIIDSQVRAETARKGIEEARKKITEIKKQVSSSMERQAVAFQNTFAADSSIDAVDSVFELAESTQLKITESPEKALSSYGDLNRAAAELLRD